MQLFRQSNHSAYAQGNALMEYIVPACIILFSAGVMLTVTDATTIMGEYFMSASGHTKSNLNGTTFKTDGLAASSYGSVDIGMDGFTSFGSMKDGGGGAAAAGGAGGLFYYGNVTRAGGRQAAATTEALFP